MNCRFFTGFVNCSQIYQQSILKLWDISNACYHITIDLLNQSFVSRNLYVYANPYRIDVRMDFGKRIEFIWN